MWEEQADVGPAEGRGLARLLLPQRGRKMDEKLTQSGRRPRRPGGMTRHPGAGRLEEDPARCQA